MKIQNFQSHKNTVLEFDKGVNVIVGPSDSGKTAIIRALRWLVWNKPGGSAFRSKWGGTTKITAEFTSGETVIREKDKSDTYHFNDLEFKAFGASTPEDIAKALNLTEVNIQSQLDKPFLLSETPGQVATYFNKVAGIDQIDQANKNVKKEISNTKQLITNLNEMLETNQEELQKYDNLDSAEVRLVELETLERQRMGLVRRKKTLFGLISDLKIIESYIKNQNKILKIEKIVHTLLEKFKILRTKKDNIFNLTTLILKINKTDVKINQVKKLSKFDKLINSIFALILKRDNLKAQIYTFKAEITRITKLDDKIHDSSKSLSDLTYLFEQQEIEICPFCGTKLEK